MEKVNALVYESPGKPVFMEIERTGPAAGQVGIEVIASSLCNACELMSYRGGYDFGYGSSYPMEIGEPGHEAVGIVVDIGEGAEGIIPGDLVVMTGLGGEPCHRSYVNRDFSEIARIHPGGRDSAEAAALEMCGCAYHCITTPLLPDEYSGKKILVIGLGAMGLFTIQILNNMDTGEIVAVDLNERRLEIASASGADRILLSDKLDIKEQYDIVIECSGSVAGQETALEMAPGTLIFSSYNTKEIKLRQSLLFLGNTTIYNPGILSSDDLKTVAGLYNDGIIKPELLIDKRINPDRNEYIDAVNGIMGGDIIKALIMWK